MELHTRHVFGKALWYFSFECDARWVLYTISMYVQDDYSKCLHTYIYDGSAVVDLIIFCFLEFFWIIIIFALSVACDCAIG